MSVRACVCLSQTIVPFRVYFNRSLLPQESTGDKLLADTTTATKQLVWPPSPCPSNSQAIPLWLQGDTAPAAVELPDDKELEVLGYLSGWRRELKRVSSLVSGRSHVQSLIADVVVRSPLWDCCLQAKTQGRSGSEPSRQLGTRKEECERSALNSKKA